MREPSSADSSDIGPDVSRAAQVALERKATDVVVLDLRGISSATDCFLLATGHSDVHVKAISEHIVEELKNDGIRPAHVEGLEGGRWVLVVLWGDAPRREFA